mgnify:CR=1 FL=1
MTRYSKTMSESLAEVRKVTPEEIAAIEAERLEKEEEMEFALKNCTFKP